MPRSRHTSPELRAYRRLRDGLAAQRRACSACGRKMLYRGDEGYSPYAPAAFTAHHVVPYSVSGTLLGDIVPMCRECNRALSDDTLYRPSYTQHTREWPI